MSHGDSDIDIFKFWGEGNKEYEPEPHVCSFFGCGRTLTAQEKLFGTKCIIHNHKIFTPMAIDLLLNEQYEKIKSLQKENDELKQTKAHLLNKFAECNLDATRCKEFLNRVIDGPLAGKELKKQLVDFVSTLK